MRISDMLKEIQESEENLSAVQPAPQQEGSSETVKGADSSADHQQRVDVVDLRDIQVIPSWSRTWTVEAMEQQLKLSFSGPGLYLDGIDTILVMPAATEGEFIAHVWNRPFQETIIGTAAQIPVYMDNR